MCKIQDTYQWIPLEKFHLTLLGGVSSILETGTKQTEKLNQLHLVRSDFHETLQGNSAGE